MKLRGILPIGIAAVALMGAGPVQAANVILDSFTDPMFASPDGSIFLTRTESRMPPMSDGQWNYSEGTGMLDPNNPNNGQAQAQFIGIGGTTASATLTLTYTNPAPQSFFSGNFEIKLGTQVLNGGTARLDGTLVTMSNVYTLPSTVISSASNGNVISYGNFDFTGDPLVSFTLDVTDLGGQVPGRPPGTVGIHDIRFADAVLVPEPSRAVLGLMGLITVFGFARRRPRV